MEISGLKFLPKINKCILYIRTWHVVPTFTFRHALFSAVARKGAEKRSQLSVREAKAPYNNRKSLTCLLTVRRCYWVVLRGKRFCVCLFLYWRQGIESADRWKRSARRGRTPVSGTQHDGNPTQFVFTRYRYMIGCYTRSVPYTAYTKECDKSKRKSGSI